MAYFVRLTFVPATSFKMPDGSTTDPEVTIINETTNDYAFPNLTDKIETIYRDIISPYQIESINYTPESVTVDVIVDSFDDIEILRSQVDYDINEGVGWDNNEDFILDADSTLFFSPDIDEDVNIMYIPLFASIYVYRDSGNEWVLI